MRFLGRFETVLFDVDGTLIDSNGAHATSWAQAFHAHGIQTDASRIRPLIGMGGDKLIPAVAGIDESSAKGRAIGQSRRDVFATLLPSLQPTHGVRPLLDYLRQGGVTLTVASSADDDLAGAMHIFDDPSALLAYSRKTS